ncbi:MAG: phage terminase small subunit P27 family [Dysosmobacter sp.]|nr:phage terminase small subunit P27 family [Dysosmobacter sp.]
MAGTRQPTDVVLANGRKHLSQAEEAARRAGEVQVPRPKTVKVPKWVPETLKADFRRLGKQLLRCGLYTDLDADNLGRYLVAQHQYLIATAETEKALAKRDQEEADSWGRIQERYFKQARNCANDMGLTVTSRCRLVVPNMGAGEQAGEEDNAFLRLIQGGAAKRA